MGVHQTQILMSESLGGGPDDFKAKFFPQGHSGLIRAHHNIELDTHKAHFHRPLKGMVTEHFPHSLSLGLWMDHIAAISDMAAKTDLIGFEDIGAENLSLVLKDIGLHIIGKPMLFQLPFMGAGVKYIGVATLDDQGEYFPDLVPVRCRRSSNVQGFFGEI